MKIRDFTILLATLFGTIAAASTLVTVVMVLDNRTLQQEVRDLRRSWSAAASESQQLKQERAEAQSASDGQGERLKQLEAELTAVKSSLATNAAAATPVPRAYRASVFLGQTYLGQGWVAPGQNATDPVTGQGRYEPIVLLDPSVRTSLGADKANAAEPREATPPTTVNYNYAEPYPYGYSWWWPTYWYWPTNGDHRGRPDRPPRPLPHVGPQPSPPPSDTRVTVTTRSYFPPSRSIGMPVAPAPRAGVGRPFPSPPVNQPLTVSDMRSLPPPGN